MYMYMYTCTCMYMYLIENDCNPNNNPSISTCTQAGPMLYITHSQSLIFATPSQLLNLSISPADSADMNFTPGTAQSVIWSAGPVGSVNNDITGTTIPVPFQHYEDMRARRGGVPIYYTSVLSKGSMPDQSNQARFDLHANNIFPTVHVLITNAHAFSLFPPQLPS